ncbi:MAG: hypothetical protein L6R38_002200 [Xanthoria sp. 2 TBL-2021]|nr:MAG: hypothetical protein L6R38_002200 [Xanthoria sp. 2 TBL-2021]
MHPEQSNNKLERASSQISNRSPKPGTVRTRSRKQSLVTPSSAKSLVSFPSLSPDNSPSAPGEGRFKSSPKLPKAPHTPFKSRPKSPSIVDALVRKTSTFKGRPALFEDSPKATGKDVPGALHHASDEHLQHLIAKDGAVSLVRQLAEDLADRDAEITSFRRWAEERERELKKMLREVEVSNLDIETRLHRVGNPDGDPVKGHAGTLKSPGSAQLGAKERLTSITDGIDQMMGQAMKDDVGTNTGTEVDSLGILQNHATQATIRASGLTSKDTERRSMNSSIESHDTSKGTVRGWKDYLWSGNGTSRKTSRASSIIPDNPEEADATMRVRGYSGGNNRRKPLSEDLFSPPARASTTQNRLESGATDDARSGKSSSSMASWTMKLFAGNPSAGRDSQRTDRGRSYTTESRTERTSRATSAASANSAMASLMKVSSVDPAKRSTKKAVPPLSLGSNSNLKSPSQPSVSQTPASPRATDDVSNLGPVEMDTILPVETRPPTQTQLGNRNQDAEYLTDRFGFIYDQRRQKKDLPAPTSPKHKHKNSNSGVEMLSNPRDPLKSKANGGESASMKADSIHRPETPVSVNSKSEEKPAKRWQDYLKVATFPTELLSHTPSSKPLTTVIEGDDRPSPVRRAPTFDDLRVSVPPTSLNPEPSTSTVTVGNAELAKPSGASPKQASPTAAETEPVQLLLKQLTELHDSIQRERTVKWNEFLRKVRAERKKQGEGSMSNDSRSKASMPEITLSDGELIGVAGLGNKGKVGRAKWKEFKQLVLAGIPVSYRAKIWAECSGASALRIPGYYDDLVNSNGEHDDQTILAQIEMDIHRTLTDNVFFRKGPGVTKLNEVLLAYSRRNPEVGYCQGMNLITASLLLIMPTAEDAFWIMTSIIENILPTQYYDRSLLASRADQKVLLSYIAEILPKLHAHFDALGIELEALTFQWFLSLFTDCLSAEALYRVWDVIFCFNDGSTFLFQVALALLKLNERALLELDSPGAVYAYIGHEMTDHAISIDGLVGASEGLKGVVKRGDVEERRNRVLEKGSRRGSMEVRVDGILSVREPRPVND